MSPENVVQNQIFNLLPHINQIKCTIMDTNNKSTNNTFKTAPGSAVRYFIAGGDEMVMDFEAKESTHTCNIKQYI